MTEFMEQCKKLALKRRRLKYKLFKERLKKAIESENHKFLKAVKRGGRTRSAKCLLAS